MLDPETIKWFTTLGVGGILAAFMFLFYRKDQKQFTELWQAQASQFASIIRDNTAAITAITGTIEALHRRDDRIEEALGRFGYRFPHRPADEEK